MTKATTPEKRPFVIGTALAVGVALACSAVPRRLLSLSQELGDQGAPAERLSPGHLGPTVEPGSGATARFTDHFWRAFDTRRAEVTLVFTDGFYREPANEGFEAVLEHLAGELRAAGYGREEGLELEFLTSEEPVSAWTPRSARLTRVAADGSEEVLLSFAERRDEYRAMLPANAPAADVSGPAVFSLADVSEGSILVTDASLRQVLRRAQKRGAAAVFWHIHVPRTMRFPTKLFLLADESASAETIDEIVDSLPCIWDDFAAIWFSWFKTRVERLSRAAVTLLLVIL